MKLILNIIIIILPWFLRRWILIKFYKYEIHYTARIGLSYIYPQKLVLKKGAVIGSFNIAIHLDRVSIGENSTICRGNWITGFSTGSDSEHFLHDKDRRSELILGRESAITKNHHIDCTNSIIIGNYVTIAGYNSQFLSHSIDIYEGRQDSKPILIGDYCFISTGVKILGGSVLPSYCVLGAGAILNKSYKDQWKLYGGLPAKPIKDISKTAKYFSREKGFTY
ncbi:MAG: acyltransferase [Rikenellaceae bacterium]